MVSLLIIVGCGDREPQREDDVLRSGTFDLLEPPGHAPGEPHPFDACPDGACHREQPAYLFSGEFHETVVDLRVSSCTVGLDLVWARRYRSRVPLPSGQRPLGNAWDHSYNIYIEVPSVLLGGPPITIHDGNARPAVFTDDGNGTWTAPRYHRSGEFDGNGRFVLTFADGGQWIFRSSGESAASEIRKLWRIIDRNGNIVELEYDKHERLDRVVNAVGQFIEIGYDDNDHIETVLAVLDEETERRVSYKYYGANDADGNKFDLKSVTLPEIADTVTDNDFPAIITTYTYSNGSAAPELNGNLLTIRDGLNQVYLRNTYATTTNPNDYEFDRLTSQAWGGVDDLITITYDAVTPSSSNGYAVTKAWVNDRVGRVSEHFFDEDNQLVMLREYTGFADPEDPTDDNNNLPAGKLRTGDPTYFQTRYGYNVDGHVSLVVFPRGNMIASVYEVDLDPYASPQTRGNLREVHRQGGTCNSGFAPLSEYYEYEPGFGNEHGERNFVVEFTDARENVTEFVYDGGGNQETIIYPEPDTREDMEYSAVGQLILHRFPEDQHGHRREIEYTYDNDGRLRETIVDPEGVALTTTREYDVACNEIRRIDPRGNDKLYTYNQHNRLTREEGPLETCSAACGGGTPTRAYTDRIYDANMNLVRVDYEALDCDGSPQANDVISTIFEYDILNEDTVTRMEVSPTQTVVSEVVLDANREVVVQLFGEATTENDPNNTVTTIYDERGLVFKEIRGAGSAEESTTQHNYDHNGNEVTLLVGLEGPTRTTSYTYDCADRVKTVIDAMGNLTEFEYDEGGNVIEQLFHGELVDISGSTSNILLERVTNVYDMMNRVVETVRDHFDPLTEDPIGDGESVTIYVYDGESRVILEADDNAHVTTRDFDDAGRPLQTVDAEGNSVELAYDASGNALTRTLTDVPSIAGTPQVGIWSYVYDARNNLIEAEDPVGNTWHHCYDSLGRVTEKIDPRENRTLYTYDGAGRLLATTYLLTDDGTGAGMVIGAAVTIQTWDDSDRLITREDPNGNVTEYAYDSLNRLTSETFADNSAITFQYDIHDNVLVRGDPNGTILTMEYDGLERLVDVDVDAGPGVNDSTTYEAYAYDGRSLLVSATDSDSEVVRTHDSLGAILTETQTYAPIISLTPTPYTVHYERDGVGNATLTSYPAGRVIERSFDGLRRTTRIDEDSTSLVELDYLGPSLLRRTYVDVDTQSDFGYDLARRMINSEHAEIQGPTFDEREYSFDESGNKQSEEDLGLGTPTGLRVMTHDSLGRMIESEVSDSAATDRTVEYEFDDAGNRTSVSGDACAGTYDLTGNDALLNQYTETPCEEWTHDSAGSLVETEASAASGLDRWFQYDHRGRLVRVWVDPGTMDEHLLIFAYDALGRKIHTNRLDFSTIEGEQYVYDGGNVIEEYPDAEEEPSATYLYGDGLDERLQMIRDESWWYYDDELGSTSAVGYRDTGTLVLERYAYQDYGEPVVLASAGSGNPYLFAGSRWFGDVSLYDMRTRHFDPVAGRFISRDSIGIWGDEENLGNGYVYVSNAPDTHTDPTGEAKKPHVSCNFVVDHTVEEALEEAERIAILARNWFNYEASLVRKSRKKLWNRKVSQSPSREWWGKYYEPRFWRVTKNYRKIADRCQNDVIKFQCKGVGTSYCKQSGTAAWTFPSNRNAAIRLCMKDPPGKGFFTTKGAPAEHPRVLGRAVMHEIAHNVGPIGDKKMGGSAMYEANQVTRLARKNPNRASWNAANYDQFASYLGNPS